VQLHASKPQPEPVASMSEPEPIVHVVEDDDLARGLIISLAKSIGLACKPFESASEFLDNFDTEQSGCVVLDIFMPGMSGLQLQTELNRRGAVIPVIFVTSNAHTSDVVAAMRQGAFNYLLKPFSNTGLLTNIRRAITYDRLNRQALAQSDRIRERISSLTTRERDILERLARGYANKAMAHEMCLSERTVELHRSRVMEKMGADSLAQLVRMFMDFEQGTGQRH
jgi:two-component system, LuxR family, response regulator FixJ